MDSGINITLQDGTHHYFGGYYHVKVLAHCIVPLEIQHFDDENQYQDARNKLGESVCFEQILEKMAVPEEDIISVQNQLVDSFRETTLGYLINPSFDRSFVRNEYRIINKSLSKPVPKFY